MGNINGIRASLSAKTSSKQRDLENPSLAAFERRKKSHISDSLCDGSLSVCRAQGLGEVGRLTSASMCMLLLLASLNSASKACFGRSFHTVTRWPTAAIPRGTRDKSKRRERWAWTFLCVDFLKLQHIVYCSDNSPFIF